MERTREEARISPLLVDCQNSRSLCRFYSRSLAVVTSVKSKLFRIFSRADDSSDLFSCLLSRRGYFFFVSKIAYTIFPSDRSLASSLPSVFRGRAGHAEATRGPKHMARKRPRGERLLPHGGPTWSRSIARTWVCGVGVWCIRASATTTSGLSDYVFPGAGGKIRARPLRRKDAGFGFLTGGSGYTRTRMSTFTLEAAPRVRLGDSVAREWEKNTRTMYARMFPLSEYDILEQTRNTDRRLSHSDRGRLRRTRSRRVFHRRSAKTLNTRDA